MSNPREDHQAAVIAAVAATTRVEELTAVLIERADEALLVIAMAIGGTPDENAKDAKRWMAEAKIRAQEIIRFTQGTKDKLYMYGERF